ncbi:hypothetical protein FS594_13205 [Rahnella aquatilis]|nr:hypothetical protein FS594_13205 [Rahnella aquatilis]
MLKLVIYAISVITLATVSLPASAASTDKMTDDEIFNRFTKQRNSPQKEIGGTILECHAMEVRYMPPFGATEIFVRDSIIVDSPNAFGAYMGNQQFTSPALKQDAAKSVRFAESSDATYTNGESTQYGNAYAISTKLKTVILYKCKKHK